MLAAPAFGMDFSVEELKERLGIAKEQLVQYRAEYERLKKVGYGGPVLRKDLEILGGNVAGLVKEIRDINELLGGVQATPLIGDAAVSLKATKESYDGPPIKGSLESGDIIALQGTVKIPGEDGDMLQSYVTWQLFDAAGEQVGDYYKREELWEVGEYKTKVRFLIQDLKSGQYTAALSHIPANNPAKLAQAKVTFAVSAPLFFHDAWITDEPGGKKISALKPGKKPYFYVTFGVDPGIEKVNVQLRAKDTGSGKDLTLEIVDYEVKPDKKEQRIGIMLEEYAVENVAGVSFEARMSIEDGPPMVVERSVSKIKTSYALKVRAAPTVMSNTKGTYSVSLPKEFVPPFRVNSSSPSLKIYGQGDGLRGQFMGTAQGADRQGVINIRVTDSQGRVAQGAAQVTIKAASAAVIASKKQPKVYSSKPQTSSSYSPPSSGSGGGSFDIGLGKTRVNDLIRTVRYDFGPVCAQSLYQPYQSAMLSALQRMQQDNEFLGEAGAMSFAAWDNYVRTNVWNPMGSKLAQLVASKSPSSCYQELMIRWSAGGRVSSSVASAAIAKNKGGGTGQAPPPPTQPTFKPTVQSKPAQPQKQCTTTKLNLNAEKQQFWDCNKRCKKQKSGLKLCLENCGKILDNAKRSKCPGGTTSGVGYSIDCTICR